MCSIWISVGFKPSAAALDAAAHRGPDSDGRIEHHTPAGLLTMAHKRLSIYALGAEGHQPMQSDDGRYTLVFNGAIYNFREIAQEIGASGHPIESNSDTQVLLQAWRHWGRDSLRRLNGMFALCIFDAREQSLTVARDRFGEKPLHVARWQQDGRTCLALSSEIPPLLGARPELAALNHEVAAGFINYSATDWTDDTFFRSIKRVPAASLLTFDLGRRDATRHLDAPATRWWSPPAVDRALSDPQVAAEALRPAFENAVRLRMIADVPVGACLSGGLDSSGIVMTASNTRSNRELTCITAQFDEHAPDGTDLSERQYVDAIAAQLRFNRRTVTPSDQDIYMSFQDVVRTQAEPFASTSVCTQWHVFREARTAGLKAMLDGQGADELFGGYPGMAGHHLADLAARLHLADLREQIGALCHAPSDFNPRGLVRATYSALLPVWLRKQIGRARGTWPPRPWLVPDGALPSGRPTPGGSRFDSLIREMTGRTSLPSLLRYEDRNAMHFGIETRLPYLDAELSDLAYRIPGSAKIANGETKSCLREALAGTVPDLIVRRRRKLGFSTPEQRWLSGALTPLREAAGLAIKQDWADFLDAPTATDLLSNKQPSATDASRAFRLISFIEWCREFRVSR